MSRKEELKKAYQILQSTADLIHTLDPNKTADINIVSTLTYNNKKRLEQLETTKNTGIEEILDDYEKLIRTIIKQLDDGLKLSEDEEKNLICFIKESEEFKDKRRLCDKKIMELNKNEVYETKCFYERFNRKEQNKLFKIYDNIVMVEKNKVR